MLELGIHVEPEFLGNNISELPTQLGCPVLGLAQSLVPAAMVNYETTGCEGSVRMPALHM